MIDAIYVQGFAAYTMNKKTSVPSVVPFGAGGYMMRLNDDFRVELAYFDLGASEPSKEVFFSVDRMPDLSGTPRSAMVAYFRARTFKDEIERTVSMAETLRSRPPLYTTTETKKTFTQQNVYESSLPTREGRAANMLSEELARANLLARNRLVMEAYGAQDELVRALNARGVDTSAGSWVDPSTGLPSFRDREPDEVVYCPIVPLPADSVVAHSPAAQSRGDLVAIQEHTARLACMVMGVPPFSVGLTTASFHTNATTNTLAGMLHMTTNRFRHLLTIVLLDIYDVLYDGRSKITVVFPATQDFGRMSDLFAKNVLTYDAYRAYVGRVLELEPRAFMESDPRALALAPAAVGAPPEEEAGGPMEEEENKKKRRIL